MQTTAKEARKKQTASFRKSAESLTRQIEEKRNSGIHSQNITARRARMASSILADADRLEELRQVLEGMATALEKNQLPRALRGITTRGMIESLMGRGYRRPGLHYSTVRDVLKVTRYMKEARKERASIARRFRQDDHEYFLDLSSIKHIDNMLALVRLAEGKPGVWLNGTIPELNNYKRLMLAGIKNEESWKVVHNFLVVYSTGMSPERAKEKNLKALESELIGIKIPGFFPTPKKVATTMVQMAGIERGMTVLEPSAGKGDIAEVILAKHPKISLKLIEINMTLSRVLIAKGFKVKEGDFLDDTGFYDRIIMNPPFENGQDIDHVRWAYSRLKPEGILVSIMCEAPFFRTGKKYEEFRDWFGSLNGTQDLLESGAFQGAEAFRQTGVSSRIITIEKRG